MKDYKFIIAQLRKKYPRAICSIGMRYYQAHDFEPIKLTYGISVFDYNLEDYIIIQDTFSTETELENYIKTLEL